MAKRNRSPEEIERRAKIRELLQTSGVSSMDDIQDLFKETIAEFMENGLDAELDEELGYSKYDYRNKETGNSRNGHSSKTLRTSFGNVDVAVLRDRDGQFEPQLLKKNQTSVSQDIEEKILSMYAKGMTTGDIEAHIRDIYGAEVSDTTVSRVTGNGGHYKKVDRPPAGLEHYPRAVGGVFRRSDARLTSFAQDVKGK